MTLSPPRPLALASLVATLDGARVHGEAGGDVAAISHDSRTLHAGALFVALRGARADGHAFVASAFAAGARAAVVDAAYASRDPLPTGATLIVVPDTRRALSRLAAVYYGRPSAALAVIGVTGTNGKTTTVHMLAAILCAGGIPTGCIGTLGAHFGSRHARLANTTPLALELQATLAAMRDDGARAVAMEISSHALATERVADVEVALGVLTNVTRDHLDFHGTPAAYAAAKRSLFERAREAILGSDDPLGRRWAAELAAAGGSPRTYGCDAGAAIRATEIVARAGGSEFTLDGTRFALPIPGRFNVRNALAAVAVAREFGIDDAASAAALRAFESVPGRMEHFARGGIDVFVDYAHTPDALAAVLHAAREATQGRLTVVFGCGGDRDRGKRPEMGRIARELADRVTVTNDNPRSEDPSAIAREIVAGMSAGRPPRIELDRGVAIAQAIREAEPGDLVVVAGKGHETYQIVRDAVTSFDDRAAVRAALAARELGHGCA